MAFGTPWDSELIRRIAVAAQCDDRTVIRVGRGDRVRPLSRRRILEALGLLGLELPPPPPEAA